MNTEHRVSIVVLTHNRRDQVVQTLRGLRHVAAGAPIIVVDNGSTDGTAAAIAESIAGVQLVCSRRNTGAAGRNLGVEQVRTPYVAFSDDDTIWEPGALARAADLLDRYDDIAVISAHVTVGPQRRDDPACLPMERSPLGSAGAGGREILGFMAGACVMRVSAFRMVGGYSARLFIGAEEMLMALDFATHGYRMVYFPEVRTRHYPSPLRDAGMRRWLLARNSIWTAWMRLPWRDAMTVTCDMLKRMSRERTYGRGLIETLSGMPWVLRHRRVVPTRVQRMWHATHPHGNDAC